MKLVVLDGHTVNPGDLSWDAFEKLVDTTVYARSATAEILARLADADLVLTNKTPLNRETLRQLPRLKYVGVIATGYNVVDIESATQLGITVTFVPTYGTASVAQFTFALLLELCHNIRIHSAAVRAGEWTKSADWSFWLTPLVELSGRTIGVVGFGRIGRQVAKIANAMGMQVIAVSHGHTGRLDPIARFVSLHELLVQSDVVTLHCPLNSETRGMISSEQLNLLKPTAFLINTSRGQLIVEQDLALALNTNRLAGAALDVLSVEPPQSDNPLLSAKNCIVTPHLAWATKDARARLMDIAAKNLAAFLDRKPLNVICLGSGS